MEETWHGNTWNAAGRAGDLRDDGGCAVMFAFDRSPAPVVAGLAVLLLGAAMTHQPVSSQTSVERSDAEQVAELDTRYQAAVEANDAATMADILHPQFELVLGDGRRVTREILLRAARTRESLYERQVEDTGTQTVRVVGDTAIVTARLWSRGRGPRGPFEYRLWFSDTYVRTPKGWQYLFGQASLPLPGP
jgi:ketosteroid isomerase-like protein